MQLTTITYVLGILLIILEKNECKNALAIIDPSTGLFEICRHPKPRKVICDQGSEFKLEFKELCETYNIMRVSLLLVLSLKAMQSSKEHIQCY